MNDVFMLDLLTFTWLLQGQAAMFSGSSAVRSFDWLLSISNDWTKSASPICFSYQTTAAFDVVTFFPGLVWFDFVLFCSALLWSGVVWSGLAWSGSASCIQRGSCEYNRLPFFAVSN